MSADSQSLATPAYRRCPDKTRSKSALWCAAPAATERGRAIPELLQVARLGPPIIRRSDSR